MRSQLPQARSGLDSHPGLLLQRYVAHPADGSERWSQAKREVHAAARGAAPCELYKTAFARWEKLLTESNTTTNVLQTADRLIVGLGSENVLETGIRLHHTYGLPIIPGSALKGLAAHYCDQAWGPEDHKFKKPTRSEHEAYRKFWAGNGPRPDDNFHRLLFGNTDDSGCIVFHDAWFVPGSEKEPLKLDVMTPHHSGWNNVDQPEPPTDFDSPIPVPFLSVTGKFLVAVSWHGLEHNQSGKWTELALSLLREALFEQGVGGKTTSGYGRFDKAKWEADELRHQKEAAQRQKEAEEAAELAAMTPLDRKIKEFLNNYSNQAETRIWFRLYDALRKPDGCFQEQEDRIEIAKMVKQGMQEAKVWKDKGKDGERKKFIESILGNQ
jgi:CRISPR-associated protein Cmr6